MLWCGTMLFGNDRMADGDVFCMGCLLCLAFAPFLR